MPLSTCFFGVSGFGVYVDSDCARETQVCRTKTKSNQRTCKYHDRIIFENCMENFE